MTGTADILPGRLIYRYRSKRRRFPLEFHRVTLGSADQERHRAQTPQGVRGHATIAFDGSHWTVTDEDSVAGTLVGDLCSSIVLPTATGIAIGGDPALRSGPPALKPRSRDMTLRLARHLHAARLGRRRLS
ncbi:MAG: hypothetical protein R2838_07230 [Caldilineaceae bacterium]